MTRKFTETVPAPHHQPITSSLLRPIIVLTLQVLVRNIWY